MTDRLAALRTMVANNPGNPSARFGLANELLKAQLFEEAAEQLALYLGQHEDEGNGWIRYADVLYTLGRHDEARTAAQSGIEAATKHRHGTMVAELEERLAWWNDDL
jgi:predicted Zn-dependent protease